MIPLRIMRRIRNTVEGSLPQANSRDYVDRRSDLLRRAPQTRPRWSASWNWMRQANSSNPGPKRDSSRKGSANDLESRAYNDALQLRTNAGRLPAGGQWGKRTVTTGC